MHALRSKNYNLFSLFFPFNFILFLSKTPCSGRKMEQARGLAVPQIINDHGD